MKFVWLLQNPANFLRGIVRSHLLRRPFRRHREILANPHFHHENPRVPWTTLAQQHILWARQIPLPHNPLQFSPEIMWRPRAGQLRKFLVARNRVPKQNIPHRIGTAVQINGSQHGLQRIHQQALLGAPACSLLTTTQMKISPQIQPVRRRQQMCGAYQMILQQAQLPFREILKAAEEPLADQPAQHRIAQKLQPFVVERSQSLIRTGTVRQGANQQRPVGKYVTQSPLELPQVA
ncbi:MAG: hypothetical protein QOJ99_2075 [Bryobacterales bacterium]|nr:hypothetical protein [Bryobacterales bacterium]